LGRICYGLKGAYNVALAKVSPLKEYYREYLRCFLNTREFYEGINNKGNRAVQAGFNQSDIQSFRLPFPTDEYIVKSFDNLCSYYFERRLLSDQESRRLAEIRDTLLPKLMSGELKVTNMDLVNEMLEKGIR
jgi:type I restriction enzyme S subunit